MARPLEGKLAIVTGASRGIGAAIAEKLASKGCNLVLNYTSASSAPLAEDLMNKLATAHGIKTITVQADVSDPADAQHLIAEAKFHFARPDRTSQIDILINNAGIAKNAPLADVEVADFTSTYRVNALGPLLVVQAALPYLPHDRTGRIVNLSSVSSDCGFVGQSVYGGSKAALEAMTRTWARELAERCTVNAVNPGPVEGPMYASNSPAFFDDIRGLVTRAPLMRKREGVDDEEVAKQLKEPGYRPAYATEVAGVVAMLCGEDAAWCTGQVVCANGGMLMK